MPFRFREFDRDDDGLDRVDDVLLLELEELLIRELDRGALPPDLRTVLVERRGAALRVGFALLRLVGDALRVGFALLFRDGETLRVGPALLSFDLDTDPDEVTRRRALPPLLTPVERRGVTRRAVGDSSSEADSSSDSREGVTRRDVGIPLDSMASLSLVRRVDVTPRAPLDRPLLVSSRGEKRTRGDARRSPSLSVDSLTRGASFVVVVRRRVVVRSACGRMLSAETETLSRPREVELPDDATRRPLATGVGEFPEATRRPLAAPPVDVPRRRPVAVGPDV